MERSGRQKRFQALMSLKDSCGCWRIPAARRGPCICPGERGGVVLCDLAPLRASSQEAGRGGREKLCTSISGGLHKLFTVLLSCVPSTGIPPFLGSFCKLLTVPKNYSLSDVGSNACSAGSRCPGTEVDMCLHFAWPGSQAPNSPRSAQSLCASAHCWYRCPFSGGCGLQEGPGSTWGCCSLS